MKIIKTILYYWIPLFIIFALMSISHKIFGTAEIISGISLIIVLTLALFLPLFRYIGSMYVPFYGVVDKYGQLKNKK